MSKAWPLTFLFIGFFFQAALKAQELSSLAPFYKADRIVKLEYFGEAQNHLNNEDRELLKLWESLLTGRAGPVSKWMKERYRLLGLNHIFTPSGFHLSAALWPLKLFLKTKQMQLWLYVILGCGVILLPGMSALKRMLSIKISQKVFGFKTGFVLAIIFDLIWGTFTDSPLGMTYSLLFLGLIYSGRTGLVLACWIFLGQMMIAYFQGSLISPWLIILNPLLSLVFGFLMPILLLLSWPLCGWQLSTGLCLLKGVQVLIDLSANLVQVSPQLEIHCGLIIVLFYFMKKYWRSLGVVLFLLSGSLNFETGNNLGMGQYEFYPQGKIISSVETKKGLKVFYEDGRCLKLLVRGQWNERCSPK